MLSLSLACDSRMTNAQMPCPVVSSEAPTTAASATPECPTNADSTSVVEIRWPDTFITSSMRPSSQIDPSLSTRAPSPAKYQPLSAYRDQYVSLYRSGSPQIPRSIDGQGASSTRYPVTCSASSAPGSNSVPSSSTIFAEMPGSGFIADPGLAAVTPGRGEIMIAPVSVCHQVSTIGVLLPPKASRYQRHASGLIGSPTVPSSRRLDRSCSAGI